MICAMSPAHNTPVAAEKWREFVAIVEEPHEPKCPICDIRHFRDKPGAPYCHMAQRFFLWCRQAPHLVTQAAMERGTHHGSAELRHRTLPPLPFGDYWGSLTADYVPNRQGVATFGTKGYLAQKPHKAG